MLRQLGQYVPRELTCVEAIAERLDVDPARGLCSRLPGVVASVLRVAVWRWTAGGPEPPRPAQFDVRPVKRGCRPDSSATTWCLRAHPMKTRTW